MPEETSRDDRVKALQTLGACITEFSGYASSYCQDALFSLRGASDTDNSLPLLEPPAYVSDDSGSGEFVVRDCESEGSGLRSKRHFDAQEVYANDEFSPHPPYDVCTPAARNIMVGDDPEHMPFLPFADDPTFDWEPYNHEYEYFSWQHFQSDPAFEVIAIETMQRLMLAGMSAATFDQMSILPARVRHGNNIPPSDRLSRLIHQRDFPNPLPNGWKHTRQFIPAYTGARPPEMLSSLLYSFCHNPNCLTGYCSVHLGRIPHPLPQTPSISSTVIAASAPNPCGKDCFLVSTSLRDVPISYTIDSQGHAPDPWSKEEEELVQTVLGCSPDALPCDLAVICRKSCSEISRYRSSYFDKSARDAKDRPGKRRKGAKPGRPWLKFNDFDAQVFKPEQPCSHPGPCNDTTGCSCSENSAHCSPNCRCDLRKCPRQWKGCQCTSRPCDTKKCPCFLALRECDPRICLMCSVSGAIQLSRRGAQSHPLEEEERGEKHDNPCANMAIQLGLAKKTKVQRGKWGLGLFMAESARKGDLISEYMGELVYGPTTRSREHIGRHQGRGYLFDLNREVAIDSTLAGNEARYINHDTAKFNCIATIRNVQGEHRIGFFATKFIPKGREILINYGSEFFKGTAKATTTETPQVPGPLAVRDQSELRVLPTFPRAATTTVTTPAAATTTMWTPRGKGQGVGVLMNPQNVEKDDSDPEDMKFEGGSVYMDLELTKEPQENAGGEPDLEGEEAFQEEDMVEAVDMGEAIMTTWEEAHEVSDTSDYEPSVSGDESGSADS